MIQVEQIKEVLRIHNFQVQILKKDYTKMEKILQSTRKEWTNKGKSRTSSTQFSEIRKRFLLRNI